MLVATPLKEAEERFRKERAELITRITSVEQEVAKTRMENRGKTRHIAELEAALEVCNGVQFCELSLNGVCNLADGLS